MFARFFVGWGIEVDFIIVDGEYREDWNHLDKSEINDLMSDYLDTANLLLDPKLSNIEILSHQQLAIKDENSNKTDTYIPFEDAVINRVRNLFLHVTLSTFCTLSYIMFKENF